MRTSSSLHAAPVRRAHRRALTGAAVAVGLLAAMPGLAGAAHAAPAAGDNHRGCPAPENLVKGTTFHHRVLAPGVTLAHGVAKDANGTVDIRTLTVKLTTPGLSLQPLRHSLATRSPLTSLAKGHSNLVAATNTGYFVLEQYGSFGPPVLPFIAKSTPVVLSEAHEPVFGFTAAGTAETGDVWLAGSVTASGQSAPITSVNEVYAPSGIALYTSAWGSSPIDGGYGYGDDTTSRTIVGGVLGSNSDRDTVPSGGELLVANGSKAQNWLSSLKSGAAATIATSVKTDATKPFVQAYGTGVTLLDKSGVATTGHECERNQQPARTAIGYTNGGKTLIIAIVADHEGTSEHGLDEDQTAALMVQLGAHQAATLDGSGSTELLARNSATAGLTPQNYLADGGERPMPLGLGIVSTPVKAAKHNKAAKKKTAKKKTAKKTTKKTTKKTAKS